MRIISLVPSWTETLVVAGAEVIGRTRFCIHPKVSVEKIPILGGTKDWDLKLIRALKPDLILLDKEENTQEMFAQAPAPCHVTHVQKVEDVSLELLQLAEQLENQKLKALARRWQLVQEKPIRRRAINEMPGIMAWLKKPLHDHQKFIYIIWKNPWMAISQNTFIGSQLRHLGFAEQLLSGAKKYYEFKMQDLAQDSLLLFSSEPYPFAKKKAELENFEQSSAIIDGEAYSWFGIRALEFIEKHK